MIIFLYSMVVKNRNRIDFPYVSAFFKHLGKLQPTFKKGLTFFKKRQKENDVTHKSSNKLLIYAKHYGDTMHTGMDPLQNRYSSKKRIGLQAL